MLISRAISSLPYNIVAHGILSFGINILRLNGYSNFVSCFVLTVYTFIFVSLRDQIHVFEGSPSWWGFS